MNITTTIVTNLTIRDDWSTAPGGYSFTDDGTKVVVTISSKAGMPPRPGKAAVAANPNANPPVAAQAAIPGTPAVLPTQSFGPFLLWGADTAMTYAQANALNNGAGYGNADLVSAITAFLAALSASTPNQPVTL